MGKFWSGFILGVIALAAATFVYIRFGYINPRADIAPGVMESALAMPSLDAAVGRRAPKIKNPVPPTDDNLVAGMKIYQAKCALCHGDVVHTEATLAQSLSPRAPQFVQNAPDMSDPENFYIIWHGIRWSGMPASGGILTRQQMWQVTTFLGKMKALPPAVTEQWKAVIEVSSSTSSSAPQS